MTMETFLDGRVTLHPGDCLDVLARLEASSIDACVTDPPYHLTSIVKRFGADNAAPAKVGKTGAYARASAGFMGKQWDGGDIAFNPDTWRAVLRVLKPGAHLLAFGGTRTFARMSVAIEDAGFEIRDTVMWLYGSGFPKSLDVSKAIDKRKDWSALPKLQKAIFVARKNRGMSQSEAARAMGLIGPTEDLGGGGFMWFETGLRAPTREQWPRLKAALRMGNEFDLCFEEAEREITGQVEEWTDRSNYAITSKDGFRRDKPASELAKQWSGFGTALKPACEPIVLARKPLEGTVAQNVLKWGTGGLNIDGCRVQTGDALGGGAETATRPDQKGNEGWTRPWMDDDVSRDAHAARVRDNVQKAQALGRWPANLILDGSEEVVGAFPADLASGKPLNRAHTTLRGENVFGEKTSGLNGEYFHSGFGDSGSAARFFYQAKPDDVWCQLCSANIAVNQSRIESTLTGASALSDAADLPPPESAGIGHQSSGHATNAASHSRQCRPPKADSAPKNAPTWDEQRIAQNVLAAARLCSSCAISIARALVEVRHSGRAAPVHLNRFTGSFEERILSRSLASYVAGRESTDTILTTANLSELFGCVFHAIAENINSEKVGSEASTRPAAKRLFYSSKADSDDRLGSKHPTVKPLDLMQYLVRLVTPPGGLVLDPFAGTGTTGEAAFREGMRAVLIEREEEYQADIRRRMALVLSGSGERTREAIKAKMKGKPDDHGPLFAPATVTET